MAKTLLGTAGSQNARVLAYFDKTQFMYDHFWMNKQNLSMHLGFWDEKTKDLHEAFVNENQYAADLLQIRKGDAVLDAGCGVGGTAIQFAETYGVKVTGTTLSEKQANLAVRHAVRRGVDGLTSFIACDYCDTNLPAGSFDKAYAIESVSYAEQSESVFSEVFRLLRTGGKLAVLDGFLIKPDMNMRQRRYYEDVCKGWVLPGFQSPEVWRAALESCGFENVRFSDVTPKVMKSSRDLSTSAKFVYPIASLLNRLRLMPDEVVLAEKTCISQLHLFQEGVVSYGAFYAEKP